MVINVGFHSTSEPKPIIILIHGLAAHRWMMLPLAWHLSRANFEPILFGYRSILGSVETHADRFYNRLQSLQQANPNRTIHIVAHSMGCIIVRQALLDSVPEALGRIVMITPPNQGSPVATRLSQGPFKLCRTLSQLSDRADSFIHELARRENFRLQPFPQTGILAASYDFVIPEQNLAFNGQTDKIVVFGGHNGMLIRPTAFRQVVHFLKHGYFEGPERRLCEAVAD